MLHTAFGEPEMKELVAYSSALAHEHVRNVAQPVLRRSYAVYCLGGSRDG
jgi:hypothetical protein